MSNETVPVAAAAAAAATTTTTTDQEEEEEDFEQRFLQNRANRRIDLQGKKKDKKHAETTASSTKTELYKFWSVVRKKLSYWQQNLDRLVFDHNNNENQQPKEEDESSSSSTDNDATADVRQRLEDLKQELYLLRKYCLSTSTSNNENDDCKNHVRTWTDEEGQSERWNVPDFIPASDLRLLHIEFTNCATKFDTVYEQIIPKEKFTFKKYRQELARRKALGLPLNVVTTGNPNSRNTSAKPPKQRQDKANLLGTGGLLENLVNVSVIVDKHGNVSIPFDNKGDIVNDDENDTNSRSTKIITAESLVLRNLQNCSVRM